MRVALNLLAFGGHAGGVGRYARELAPAMLAARDELQLELFAPNDRPAWVDELAGHDRVRLTSLRIRSDAPLALYPAQLVALGALADRAGCDLVHGVVNFVPLAGRVPRVVTIHDLMWIDDPGLSGFSPVAARIWRALTAASAAASAGIVVDSEATAGDVRRHLGADQAKITTVLLGAGIEMRATPTDADALRDRLDLADSRVLLSVGQKQPHKNLEAIVRALPALPDEVVLVAPGADSGHGARVLALAAESGVADRVRLLDWVDDSDLEGLYGLAAACVQVSLVEGFGLPALEAMQRGVPTVVSDTPALAEATGGAALVVPARDDRALAVAVRRILDEPAVVADLRERGHARCAELTWDRTARQTLGAYDRALGAAR